ncbi:MAG: HD domain-containing protein [Christensenellales bacterium]
MIPALPKSLLLLADLFYSHGFPLYLVGGYVRNIVLGLPGGDFDICSAALPDIAAKIARDAGYKVIEKAVSLGTIEIHINTKSSGHIFEHTTFRRDYYPSGGEHRPSRVTFAKSVEDDARRRDFTIGTLYLDILTAKIYDPTAKGLSDIKHGILRSASENPKEMIRDDGLRIMRMARFSSELNFSIEKSLLACAKRHAKLLADISAERKRDELVKILLSDTKYTRIKGAGPLRGLKILYDTGALEYVLPRLYMGKEIKQSEHYHKYDVLFHNLHACAAAPAKLNLRLAALLHDIGKPSALSQYGKMYGHEIIGEALAKEELRELKFDNNTIKNVLPLIKYHMFDLEAKAKPKTIRRRAVSLGKKIFSDLIELRRADMAASKFDAGGAASADNWQAELEKMERQNVPWSEKELNITGTEILEILGAGPSKTVGQILKILHNECISNPEKNTNSILKKRAQALAKRLQQ